MVQSYLDRKGESIALRCDFKLLVGFLADHATAEDRSFNGAGK
jgi:hypothetical protein